MDQQETKETQTESVEDLELTNQHADSTKGGAPANFAGTWTLDKSKSQSINP